LTFDAPPGTARDATADGADDQPFEEHKRRCRVKRRLDGPRATVSGLTSEAGGGRDRISGVVLGRSSA